MVRPLWGGSTVVRCAASVLNVITLVTLVRLVQQIINALQ